MVTTGQDSLNSLSSPSFTVVMGTAVRVPQSKFDSEVTDAEEVCLFIVPLPAVPTDCL